jgi:hypothetical protein
MIAIVAKQTNKPPMRLNDYGKQAMLSLTASALVVGMMR